MLSQLYDAEPAKGDELTIDFGNGETFSEHGSVFFSYFPSQIQRLVDKRTLLIAPCTMEVYNYVRSMLYGLNIEGDERSLEYAENMIRAYEYMVSWDIGNGCVSELGIAERITSYCANLPISVIEKLVSEYTTGVLRDIAKAAKISHILALPAFQNFLHYAKFACYAYNTRKLETKYARNKRDYANLFRKYISSPGFAFPYAMSYNFGRGGQIYVHKTGRQVEVLNMSIPKVDTSKLEQSEDGLPKLTFGSPENTGVELKILTRKIGDFLPLTAVEVLTIYWNFVLKQVKEKFIYGEKAAEESYIVAGTKKAYDTLIGCLLFAYANYQDKDTKNAQAALKLTGGFYRRVIVYDKKKEEFVLLKEDGTKISLSIEFDETKSYPLILNGKDQKTGKTIDQEEIVIDLLSLAHRTIPPNVLDICVCSTAEETSDQCLKQRRNYGISDLQALGIENCASLLGHLKNKENYLMVPLNNGTGTVLYDTKTGQKVPNSEYYLEDEKPPQVVEKSWLKILPDELTSSYLSALSAYGSESREDTQQEFLEKWWLCQGQIFAK